MSKPRFHLVDTIRAQADAIAKKESQNKLLMDSQKHDLRLDYSTLFHLQTYYHFLMGQSQTALSLMITPPDVLEGKTGANGEDMRKKVFTPKGINPEEGD